MENNLNEEGNNMEVSQEDRQDSLEVAPSQGNLSKSVLKDNEITNTIRECPSSAFSQQDECKTIFPSSTYSNNDVLLSTGVSSVNSQGFLPQVRKCFNKSTPDDNNSGNVVEKQVILGKGFIKKNHGRILPNVDSLSVVSEQDGVPLMSQMDLPQQDSVLTHSQDEERKIKKDSWSATVGKLMISEAFLSVNTVTNRPTLQAAKTINKTFAQIAAPPTVVASIPSKGTSPDCGLLVERIKGSTLDEYARAIETVTGKKTLVFIGQSPEDTQFVMAFLEQPTLVNMVVPVGITIKGKWLCVTHLRQPASKLIISDVLPYVPDSIILNACKAFGEPVFENLRRIPSSVRAFEYKHLLSFRRELLIVLDKKKIIPDNIIVFSHGTFHKLGITVPGLVCFNCRMHGHKASNCRQPKHVQSNEETINEAQTQGGLHSHAMQLPTGDHQYSSLASGRLPATQIESWGQPDPKDVKSGTKVTGGPQTPHQAFVPPLSNIIIPTIPPPPDRGPATDKGNWLVANKKKGKAVPLKNTVVSDSQVVKAPKLGKFADIATVRKSTPVREELCSPDALSSDEKTSSTTDEPGVNTNKRKQKQTKKVLTEVTAPFLPGKLKPTVSPPTLSQPQNKTAEIGGVAQLKKILAKQQGNKSKVHNKDILGAQPIIEDLLNSVWSLRSSRRRAALSEFQERHDQIFKYLDIVMAVIPADMHSCQVYRTLASIKQDLKAVQPADSRKSRISRT